jgi:enamine deaminase RidA (YjgF/YER057c/UK114 family)
MEIIEILKEIIPLLTGLAGLISTGIAAYFAIVNFIKHFKDKKAAEIWNLVMTIADAAMKEAEASQLDGEGKKQLVIDTVKAGLEAAGLDLTDFLDQLSKYIDDTIKFTKEMQKAKELKELNK